MYLQVAFFLQADMMIPAKHFMSDLVKVSEQIRACTRPAGTACNAHFGGLALPNHAQAVCQALLAESDDFLEALLRACFARVSAAHAQQMPLAPTSASVLSSVAAHPRLCAAVCRSATTSSHVCYRLVVERCEHWVPAVLAAELPRMHAVRSLVIGQSLSDALAPPLPPQALRELAPGMRVASQLLELQLHGIDGSGWLALESALASMRHLRHMSIRVSGRFQRSGTIISHTLVLVTALRSLDLCALDLVSFGATAFASALRTMPQLTQLRLLQPDVLHAAATAELAPAIQTLTNLRVLAFSKSRTLRMPALAMQAALAALPSLTRLEVASDALRSGLSLEGIGSATRLRHLDIRGCSVSSADAYALARFEALTSLMIDNIKIGVESRELARALARPQLQHFHIGSAPLQGSECEAMRRHFRSCRV